MALTFEPERLIYDASERLIRIFAIDGPKLIACAVSKAALIALEDRQELEISIPVARRQVAGLAILGPCCDRAVGVLARARGDETSASAAFERALVGFEALKAATEAEAMRALIS